MAMSGEKRKVDAHSSSKQLANDGQEEEIDKSHDCGMRILKRAIPLPDILRTYYGRLSYESWNPRRGTSDSPACTIPMTSDHPSCASTSVGHCRVLLDFTACTMLAQCDCTLLAACAVQSHTLKDNQKRGCHLAIHSLSVAILLFLVTSEGQKN